METLDQIEVKTNEAVNPFDDASFVEMPEGADVPKLEDAAAKTDAAKTDATQAEVKPEVTDTKVEAIDPNEYLKKELGYESWDQAKAELNELRTIKEKAAQVKFENEESEKLYNLIREGKTDDVYNLLDRKNKLSKAGQMNAADALKLHLQLTNNHFTAEDVADVFEEKYTLPKKPAQREDELDDEYQQRVSEWQVQHDKVTRRIERDARVAKEELKKLNQNLSLPDITAPVPAEVAEAQRKESERIQKLREQYLQALETDASKATGFSVEYKNEDVTIPVSYAITDAERTQMKDRLKTFDLDGFIRDRWFTEGKPNVGQMMQDIYLMENRSQVLQKIVTETASKMQAEMVKRRSNIDLNNKGNQGTFNPGDEQDYQKAQASAIWEA